MGSYESSNYEQLVKALRYCSHDGLVNCNECKYGGKEWPIGCEEEMMADAADAIEALQKRLVNALTALHLANEKMGYYGIQPYTEADGEDMISDWVKTLVHEELEQQLPKRGEWKATEMYMTDECTACGFLMNWEDVPAWLFDMPHFKDRCPNCGAKMEVQE